MKGSSSGRRPSVMATVVLGLTMRMGSMLKDGESGIDGEEMVDM